MSVSAPTVATVPPEPTWPEIVIRDPQCHQCPGKTFVIFEELPWCKRHFLDRVGERETARQAGVPIVE